MKEVSYTKGIPICPVCDKPTHRTDYGTISTSMSVSYSYDESGDPLLYDPNTYTQTYFCQNCRKEYGVKTQYGKSEYTEGFKMTFS